uniref:Uncharacterized protein n=1 Tax=Arundo donax TaxID=35708 RepID=A0A0A8YBT8_ARUDO
MLDKNNDASSNIRKIPCKACCEAMFSLTAEIPHT